MSKRKAEDVVYEITKPITDRRNFELVEVEYQKEGADWYLRIYIDKEGGITIEDCQAVSEELSDILDEVDPIDHAYIFEVSSPGIDRPLKNQRDYEKNMGKLLEIKFFKPINGKKAIEGILTGYSEDKVEIDQDGNKVEIDKKDISIIRPVVKF